MYNTFSGHTDWVRSIAFSPNGKMIASGSNDSTVLLSDLVALDKESNTQSITRYLKVGACANR
ncbi:hypothetical protein F4212_07540 [Candidatus Poribacteria bacterium]|nr:hypothetical protein [Candidatus Poribacteria bacterium]